MAIWYWVSSSASEPRATDRKRRYSGVERRAAPSAMFDGTLTAARRNCDVSPNRSAAGKCPEKAYTASTSVMASCHTRKFSCGRFADSPFSIPHSLPSADDEHGFVEFDRLAVLDQDGLHGA